MTKGRLEASMLAARALPSAWMLLLAAVLALVGPQAAGAADTTLFTAGLGATAAPDAIIQGADGNLWFTDSGNIDRITPDGTITQFSAPGYEIESQAQLDVDALTAGPGGNVWFIAYSSGAPQTGAIGEITPSGAVSTFPLNGLAPVAITHDQEGDIWFSYRSSAGGGIARMTASGTVTTYPGIVPTTITLGPDGNVWFGAEGEIGRISHAGRVTMFRKGLGTASITSIVSGPQHALWFLYGATVGIGRIAISGDVTIYRHSLNPQMVLAGLAAGADGNLWFTFELAREGAEQAGVGRMTPAGQVSTFQRGFVPSANDGSPQTADPIGITPGPDATLWFTAQGAKATEGTDNSPIGPAAIGEVTTSALLSIPSQQLRMSPQHRVTVELTCGHGTTDRCTGTLAIDATQRTARGALYTTTLTSTARVSLKGGARSRVQLALSQVGQRLLSHSAGGLKVTATARCAGAIAKTTITLTSSA